MAADALSPIELEVCLHKTSDRADEIIDTVLLSFSDCQSFVAVTEVEYGIQVVGIYVVELLTDKIVVNILDMTQREIYMAPFTRFLYRLFIVNSSVAGIEDSFHVCMNNILLNVVVIFRPLEWFYSIPLQVSR